MKPLEIQLSVSLLGRKNEIEREGKGRTSCPWNYPPSRSSGSPSSCIARRRRRRHSVPLLAPRTRRTCAKEVSIPGRSRSVLTLLLALSSSSSPSAGKHDLGSRVAASRKWTPAPVQTRQKNKWVAQNLIRPLESRTGRLQLSRERTRQACFRIATFTFRFRAPPVTAHPHRQPWPAPHHRRINRGRAAHAQSNLRVAIVIPSSRQRINPRNHTSNNNSSRPNNHSSNRPAEGQKQ